MTVSESLLIEIAIIFFVVVATVVAIKIGVSFDINAWIKLRHERNKERLKIICPHTEIEMKEDESIECQTLFHSPAGTVMWICSRCGFTTSDANMPRRLMEFFAQNPRAYIYRSKKFEKLARKTYGI